MSDTVNRMRYLYDEALALAERKNADYGDAWKLQGWRGNLSRIFEKDQRLRTLLWRGEAAPPSVRENVRETAIDMINTLTFFVMNYDAGVEWGHENPYPSAVPYFVPQPPADYEPPNGWVEDVGTLNPETTAKMATLAEQTQVAQASENYNPFDQPAPDAEPEPEPKTGKPSPHRRQPARK